MKKHILIVSQYFYPEQFRINDLATEWKNRKYEVTVITGIPNYPKGKFYEGYGIFKKRKERYHGVNIVRLPIIPRGQSALQLILNYISFVVVGYFWKCLTPIKADYTFIFEVSPMTQALLGVWYAKRREIPCYIYVQDLWPENVEIIAKIKNGIFIRLMEKMVYYIYINCCKIFVTSKSFAKSIKKRNIDENKIIYWPQYAEEYYSPSSEKSELITEGKVPNITFTGNIGTAQGLEILPEVAVILKKRKVKVKFNIVGDGRNKKNLKDQINEKKVEEYFNLVSWQPAISIPKILASSNAAFLSFSNNKIFSMTIPAKLQSYMACGIPVIGSVSGESEKIINEAYCGLTCSIGNTTALAEIIIKFIQLSNYEKRQMAINAIAYSKLHFNKKNLMDFIDNYFE